MKLLRTRIREMCCSRSVSRLIVRGLTSSETLHEALSVCHLMFSRSFAPAALCSVQLMRTPEQQTIRTRPMKHWYIQPNNLSEDWLHLNTFDLWNCISFLLLKYKINGKWVMKLNCKINLNLNVNPKHTPTLFLFYWFLFVTFLLFVFCKWKR